MRGLTGKRALITGGCGDIGRAVAGRLIEEGAAVVLADLLPVADGLERAKAVHPDTGYLRCDVTDSRSADAAVRSAADLLGGLDIAISNAGIVANAPLLDASNEDWQRTLDVNLSGSFYFARAAAGVMKSNPVGAGGRRGTIVFTGSWVQEMPWPESVAYCASKGGQQMVMRVAAQELASLGITCNIVAPGLVSAGLTRSIYDRDEIFRRRVDVTVPLGRLCGVDEVAGSFAFLCSDDAAYITGTSIVIDGGAGLVRRDA